MKRLVVISIVLAAFIGVKAQDLGETPAPTLLSYSQLEKKLSKSDDAIKDEKKGIKASTWFSRGKLMQDIYMLDLENLYQGMGKMLFERFYKDPLNTETGEDENIQILSFERMKYYFESDKLSHWERLKYVTDDPLGKAFDAYVKTLELDEKGKLTKGVKEQFEKLRNDYKQDGLNYYSLEDVKGALENFEMVLKINELDLFEGEIDTTMIYYCGILSRQLEDYKSAIKHYKQLAKIGYGATNIYLNIKSDYLALEDTLGAIEIMEEAHEVYPDSVNIISNLFDIIIKAGELERGKELVDKAIAANPNEGNLYYWKGRIYLKEENDESIDGAKESYKKAIEVSPELYYPYYDLGFIYFFEGQEMFSNAGLERDAQIREEMNKEASKKYEDAVPLMKRALELNSSDPLIKKEALDVLKRVYYKLYGSEDQRYIDVMEEIDNI